MHLAARSPSCTETFELDGGADGAATDAADAAVVLGAFPKPGKPRRVRCCLYYLGRFQRASIAVETMALYSFLCAYFDDRYDS